ncbi:DUF4345 domain-containing protein [Rothia uropygioeca]|uniref:DUF4345 domain-containing protein n=1 Tax=Kocuria sp. 257 TaxID=2021970 RepID=UPI0010106905|nr:DUF4345 domain-containing protein [Kocuria sp. 257]
MTHPSSPENNNEQNGHPRGPWENSPESESTGPTGTSRDSAEPSSTAGPGRTEASEPRTRQQPRQPRAEQTRKKTSSTPGPAKTSSKPGKQQDWGIFRTVVALYGLVIIAYGVWQIFAGTASLPGETEDSSATVASSYGALAAVLCGVGAAFVAIAVKFKWANVLWFVCLMIFLGGIGRIFSWAIFGLPHAVMIVVMVLDLVIPPCLLVWHAWISKANRIRTEMSQGAPQAAPRNKRGKKRS